MTGDWASSVQILRRVDFSEVPVVVLNDVKLIVNIFDDIDIFYQTHLIEFVAGETVQHHVNLEHQ